MEEYKRLDSKSRSSMYLGNLIFVLFITVLIAVVLHYAMDYKMEYLGLDETQIYMIAAVIVTVIVIYSLIWPQIFYRRYSYLINDERIDVKRGVIIIRRTMVPIERVHQVEVTRGPINNLFGLANVQVTTAGGVATIEFLEIDVAEDIAKRLNTVINQIVKGTRHDTE